MEGSQQQHANKHNVAIPPANPWPSSTVSDKYMSFGPRLRRDLIRRHPPIQARMILRSPQTRGARMTDLKEARALLDELVT